MVENLRTKDLPILFHLNEKLRDLKDQLKTGESMLSRVENRKSDLAPRATDGKAMLHLANTHQDQTDL